jgi:hypothetical protein
MKYYPMVWILWGADAEGKYIVELFAHKIMAEETMRLLLDIPQGAHYWIQEKEVNGEQS